MRTILALAALGAASYALVCAQALTSGEDRVNQAFQALRREGSIWMRMRGTDTLGSTTTDFLTDTFWNYGYDTLGIPFGRLETVEAKAGIVQARIVGDGTTLWAYNPLRKEYNATTYGTIGGTQQPPTYFETLLNGFATHAKGTTIHIARLLREVYAGGFALYRPWLIGARERVLTGGMTMDDPVLGNARRYTSSPTVTYVVFWVGDPATRSLAFEIEEDPTSGNVPIRNVYYADATRVGGSDRLLEWRIALQRVAPTVGNFSFVPPAGSRAVARQGGGL